MFSSNDNKIKKLDYKYPVVGYGIFFKLLEMLYQQDGKLEYDLDFIAYNLNYDKKVIKAVLNDFELFEISNGIITNKRVTESIAEIIEKSEKAKRSQSFRKYNK